MSNGRKAIVLDMDETLEHGIMQEMYAAGNGVTMILRPGLDTLVAKLQEAKKDGIDVILCTTAKDSWVERFLNLKPEFKTLFDKMYTRDNKETWKEIPCDSAEYAIYNADRDLKNGKPVTTFGYDSILFIDDNRQDGKRLEKLFESAKRSLEKDVTYFSGFGFADTYIELFDVLRYQEAAQDSQEIAQKLDEYFKQENSNPGCNLMCLAIDYFVNSSFNAGFTNVDEKFAEEYKNFIDKCSEIDADLYKLLVEYEKRTGKTLPDFSKERMASIRKYLSSDKKYPFEGIEVGSKEDDKRKRLASLVEQAKGTQEILAEAENLEEKFQIAQGNNDTGVEL